MRQPVKEVEPVRLSRTNQAAGTAVHQLIPALIAEFGRPSGSEIEARAIDYFADRRYEAPKASIRTKTISNLGVYFREFAPPEVWSLATDLGTVVGAEVDLGWSNAGVVLVDELKTMGAWQASAIGKPTHRQARRYVKACRASLGETFAGIRLVLLSEPAASLLYRPDGSYEPLRDSEFWFSSHRYVDPAADDEEGD